MPGRGAEHRAGHIQQLGFDSLEKLPIRFGDTIPPGKQNGIATATSDVATTLKGEVYRPAPAVRRKAKKHAILPEGVQQSSLDELFTLISREADIPRTITISETW